MRYMRATIFALVVLPIAANAQTVLTGPVQAGIPGAYGDGVTNDTAAIAAACTTQAAIPAPLIFTERYRISGNTSLACDVIFSPGAYLTVDTGITITLAKNVIASDGQWIF